MRYPQVAIGFHLVVSIVMVIHALEDLGAPPYIVLGIFHVYVYHLYNIYIYILYTYVMIHYLLHVHIFYEYPLYMMYPFYTHSIPIGFNTTKT